MGQKKQFNLLSQHLLRKLMMMHQSTNTTGLLLRRLGGQLRDGASSSARIDLATSQRGIASTIVINQSDVVSSKVEYKKNGGFLSNLLGSSTRLDVPLTDPLPGMVIPNHVPPPSSQPKTEMTTLANGFKVASENTPGATATLGLYVNSGSIYEDGSCMGVSHLLEYMAFKATMNRTHLRLVREVEAIGGNVMASASREQMAYTVDTSKATIPEALEILSDAVLNPKFELWEVKENIAKMEEDLKNLADNPQTTLLEALHSVAFQGALGRPLIAPKDAISGLSPELLREFVQTHYVAPRMVLSGAGVEHEQLVRLAEPLLSGVSDGPIFEEPASQYVGGDWRQFAAGPMTHAVLAFEYAGGWRDIKGSVAMTVLQYLLGGGGSFSCGRPWQGNALSPLHKSAESVPLDSQLHSSNFYLQ